MMEALLDAGFNRFGIGKDYIHVDMDPREGSERRVVLILTALWN